MPLEALGRTDCLFLELALDSCLPRIGSSAWFEYSTGITQLLYQHWSRNPVDATDLDGHFEPTASENASSNRETVLDLLLPLHQAVS
jgi:hypothetical protein